MSSKEAPRSSFIAFSLKRSAPKTKSSYLSHPHKRLLAQVYIVWSGPLRSPRIKTTAYKVCLIVQLGYVAINVLYFIAKSSKIQGDGACVLGLRHFATIPLVIYDFIQNVLFTFMFLWPLYRSKVMNPALRRVAKRTLIGAVSGLSIFAANTLIIIGFGGHELDWVTLNALIIYWVSSGPPSDEVNHAPLPRITVTTGSVWVVDSPNNTNTRGISLATMEACSHIDHNPGDPEQQNNTRTDLTRNLSLADSRGLNSEDIKSETNSVNL
ncbi:hypothetical protein V5O48_010198 [Marasmius crinis-equi]|uniref:Uncharacterized protein n=1 Tax=Marasmius crinis-equi TaxID=585013 RepID=A0ABR3F8Z9_9AGAR